MFGRFAESVYSIPLINALTPVFEYFFKGSLSNESDLLTIACDRAIRF
jgi:hypothetical protein